MAVTASASESELAHISIRTSLTKDNQRLTFEKMGRIRLL